MLYFDTSVDCVSSAHPAGAADDAAQVGVMMELARVVATGSLTLAAPVILLFTGGEETISQVCCPLTHPMKLCGNSLSGALDAVSGNLREVWHGTGADPRLDHAVSVTG